MTIEKKVHGLRLHVIRRQGTRQRQRGLPGGAGISHALERYGPDGVHPSPHHARPGRCSWPRRPNGSS